MYIQEILKEDEIYFRIAMYNQPSLLEINQSLRKITFSFITVTYTQDYFASDYRKYKNCLFIILYNTG